jgi:hypothetical protein
MNEIIGTQDIEVWGICGVDGKAEGQKGGMEQRAKSIGHRAHRAIGREPVRYTDEILLYAKWRKRANVF